MRIGLGSGSVFRPSFEVVYRLAYRGLNIISLGFDLNFGSESRVNFIVRFRPPKHCNGWSSGEFKQLA